MRYVLVSVDSADAQPYIFCCHSVLAIVKDFERKDFYRYVENKLNSGDS
jgi:hypothetical protein